MGELSRTDKRLAVAERLQALDRLEAVAVELNQIAAWLGGFGVETEADMAERAARDLLAACWLLSRPLRPEPPPDRWLATDGQQAAAGRYRQ
jgi:hypothetical protein